jgi:hypothetical protein
MENFTQIMGNITTLVVNQTESNDSHVCSNFPEDEFVPPNSTGSNFYINAIIYPIILAIGTVGNILTLIVLGLDKNKSTIHIYLICMAASNLCVV